LRGRRHISGRAGLRLLILERRILGEGGTDIDARYEECQACSNKRPGDPSRCSGDYAKDGPLRGRALQAHVIPYPSENYPLRDGLDAWVSLVKR
jgi:hypothetical protein